MKSGTGHSATKVVTRVTAESKLLMGDTYLQDGLAAISA